MNRRTLLKRAAALVLAPSLVTKLPPAPAPAPAFVSPEWIAPGPYDYRQIVRTPIFPYQRRSEWLGDEILPVYSELAREHRETLDRLIWMGV